MDKKEEIRKKTLEELESMKDNVDNAIKNIKNFEGVDVGYEVMQNGAFITNIKNIMDLLKDDRSFNGDFWVIKNEKID